MKLVIEIDNSIYDICKSVRNLPLDENDIMSSLIMQSIANGTPLTESQFPMDFIRGEKNE